MITVTVPATSANVGAGFDSLGLAVSMYNVFTFEEADRIQITSVDGTHIPTGSNNLVYRSARVVYDQLGIPIKGLRITQKNTIPMARGLGSSSACIVAGILGANALLGNKLTRRQMLTMSLAFCKPTNAINRPMPTLTADFSVMGMALKMASRTLVRERMIKTMPSTKTASRAICQL